MHIKQWAVLSLGIVAMAFPSASATAMQLEVQGTEIVLRPDRGSVLHGESLIGTLFTLRTEQGDQPIRIDGFDRQSTARGAVALYRFSVPEPESGAWTPLCKPDVRGREVGFPIPDGTGAFSLTCTSGAEGKCILLGYRPWEDPPGGIPMRQLFEACIHLIRADYGGDGRPTTRDGTTIDVYDRFGIQSPSHFSGTSAASGPVPPDDDRAAATAMAFEAAWGPGGAVCVAHPRIAAHVSLDDLARRYPGLRDHVGPAACTEDAMRADGRAILFNRSRVTSTAD